MNSDKPNTVDPAEIARFEAMAAEWWNPERKIPPAAQVQPGPAGLYPRPGGAHASARSAAPQALRRPAHPRHRLRRRPAVRAAGPARRRGRRRRRVGRPISRSPSCMPPKAACVDYRATTAEELADAGESFDIVLNMEVVEHVADVDLFIDHAPRWCGRAACMFVATINRTAEGARPWRSSAPNTCCAGCRAARINGTNSVTPDELRAAFRAGDLDPGRTATWCSIRYAAIGDCPRPTPASTISSPPTVRCSSPESEKERPRQSGASRKRSLARA